MPKQKGLHPDKALSAIRVRQLKTPGRYTDGNGLYLVVSETGGKRWLLRILVHGRRRDMGLGSVSLVSLAEARELATKYRKIAREGGDPIAERNAAQRSVPAFAEAATALHATMVATWKNPKHGQQWINTIETYAVPHIGQMQLDHVQPPDILRVLGPIWLAKPETARRVRQRLKTIFDWAKTSGHRSGDNPVDNIELGLPKQTDKQKHHAAMPFRDVPAFMKRLRSTDTRGLIGRQTFEFLILTAARTSEVIKAEWSEVDLQHGVWTIPATRMKADREHRVPLQTRAKVILEEIQDMGLDDRFVFPGSKPGKPQSNMVLSTILKRMEIPYTAHGFRSTFRDWVAETTEYPNELAEMALAHTVSNKVEAAYRRGDMLDRRRKMMEDWETSFGIK